MLIDIYIKCIENIMNRFQFTVQTQNCVTDKVPREITKKSVKQHSWFLHSARPLKLIDICMKFRENSLTGFQVIERP